MMASSSGGSYGRYANVWCKNETDSFIKKDGVTNFKGTGTLSENFDNICQKSPKKEALKFCDHHRMKLWYPSRPFENVLIGQRKLIGLTSNWLFWSSLKRKNTTHFETPINEIVLEDWLLMGNAEKNCVLECRIISYNLYEINERLVRSQESTEHLSMN